MNNPCCCEHAEHPLSHEIPGDPHAIFPEFAMTAHVHMGVPAGKHNAAWVGPVCDDCANTHMSKYLTP